jgi:purine-binding chemotaxis protein CheW
MPEDPVLAGAIPVGQRDWGGHITLGITRIGVTYVGIPIDDLSEVYQIVKLSPLLAKSSYLSGSFDLRGHLIPVLDLGKVCCFDHRAEGVRFAVVLRHGGRLLAFLVDEVMGIVQIDADRLQSLETVASGCVLGAFLDKDRPISVLNVSAIFDLPGVCSVKAPQVAQTHEVDAARVPMLIFEVGGARFAVRAEDIYGTVPRQVIETNAITSRLCLGSITYHNRRVPVLCTVSVLGLGRRQEISRTEVVILRCPGDQLLGLAVDSIQTVQAIDPKRRSAIPRAIAGQNGFLPDVLITEVGGQIYTIATDRLLADPTIASIASLSSRAFKEQDLAPQDQPGTLKRLPQGERFLVFQAGRPIAVPLSQVTCILQPPRVIVPVTEAVNGLVGYFARLRDSVLLVDLNSFLGVPLQSSEFCRVLLTGEQDHQVGFRVERVHSIETSTWLLQGWTREGPGSEPLVQLGLGAARQALPVVDLMRIADDLFGLTPNSGIV